MTRPPAGLQTGTPPDEQVNVPRAHRTIAGHGILLSASAALVGVLSYTCTLLMAHALSPADFSKFAAAQMLLGMVGIVTSALVPLPLSHAVTSFPPGSEERRDAMAFAVLISVMAGLVAALVSGFVIAGLGSAPTAAIVALSSFVLFLGAAPSGWFQGELRFMRYTLKSVGEIVIRFLFSLLVVAFSWGAPGAVLGFAMGGLALFITPKAFLQDFRWRPRVLTQKRRWAETADIAAALCIVSVLVGADVVVVAFLDPGSPATAGFQALASIAKAPVYIAAGTGIVMFPLLRRSGIDVNVVLLASLYSFGRMALFACATIAASPYALVALVLPQKYHHSILILPWLALAGLGYAGVTLLVTILLGRRAYRRCQLGLILITVLIPGSLLGGWVGLGVTGLAVGCAVGSVLAAAVLFIISYPVLPPRSGRLAARGLLMAAGLYGVLLVASAQPVIWLLVVVSSGLLVLAQLKQGPTASLSRTMQGAAHALTGTVRQFREHRSILARGRRQLAFPAPIRALVGFTSCVAFAFGVRSVGLTTSFEVWVDEALYALLGQSVSAGNILPALSDGPFFLHPPGFFWVEGAIIHLFGVSGNNLELVLQLRWLNAVLGAVTVGLAFLVVRRVGNRAAAWVAAGLLSFEPFVLRSNSHVFLETLAMTVVLGGLLIVVSQMQRGSTDRRPIFLFLGGVLMGYAVLTKDFFALCTAVPLVAATMWRQTLRLHDSARVLSAMLFPYVIYMSIVVADGMFPDWLLAKTAGLGRLIGLEKTTGFSTEGSPSLISRVIDNAGHFGSSYVLLGLCPVAAVLLCFSLRPERRLIGLVSLTLGTYGIYSAVFGTFEEQYGYGVMIAGVLGISVLSAEVHERRPGFRRSMALGGVFLLLLTGFLGARLETSGDNGFRQARRWAEENLPAEARISVTNSTAELAFQDDPRFGVWPSATLMLEHGANYILTQSLPTSQGYGYMEPRMLPWLETNATAVFSLSGLTNGTTTLWFVNTATLAAGARSGIGTWSSPDKTGL